LNHIIIKKETDNSTSPVTLVSASEVVFGALDNKAQGYLNVSGSDNHFDLAGWLLWVTEKAIGGSVQAPPVIRMVLFLGFNLGSMVIPPLIFLYNSKTRI
jgi:hypothetical protein